jgi:hypothetical protein
MREAEFQRRIIEAAKWHGWRYAHFNPAQVRKGQWATPQSGDKGFPDLVLARDGAVILAELKTDKGRLGEGQPEWLDALGDHGRLWRPAGWDSVLAELTVRRAA